MRIKTILIEWHHIRSCVCSSFWCIKHDWLVATLFGLEGAMQGGLDRMERPKNQFLHFVWLPT
jgi:hypothetical protein